MNLESKIRYNKRLGFIRGYIIGISIAIGMFFSMWLGAGANLNREN